MKEEEDKNVLVKAFKKSDTMQQEKEIHTAGAN